MQWTKNVLTTKRVSTTTNFHSVRRSNSDWREPISSDQRALAIGACMCRTHGSDKTRLIWCFLPKHLHLCRKFVNPRTRHGNSFVSAPRQVEKEVVPKRVSWFPSASVITKQESTKKLRNHGTMFHTHAVWTGRFLSTTQSRSFPKLIDKGLCSRFVSSCSSSSLLKSSTTSSVAGSFSQNQSSACSSFSPSASSNSSLVADPIVPPWPGTCNFGGLSEFCFAAGSVVALERFTFCFSSSSRFRLASSACLHFILLFWNQTLTCEAQKNGANLKELDTDSCCWGYSRHKL